MKHDPRRQSIIGEIRDLVAQTTAHTNPFLHFLPELLSLEQFTHIDPQKVQLFVKLCLADEKQVLVVDALHILNQLVHEEDGSLIKPAPNMFYNNSHFFWKELGDRKEAIDCMLHILNKTLFTLSMGNA